MSVGFLAGVPAAPARPSTMRFAIAPALGLALLVALAFWFASETRGADRLQATIRTSDRTRAQATRLLGRLADAEAAERGFRLSGQAPLLRSFVGARADIEAGLADLDAALAETPSEQATARQLRQLVHASLDAMARATNTQTDRDAGLAARGSEGAATARIRPIVDGLIATESARLDQRLAVLQPRNRLIGRIVWALGIAIATMLIGVTLILVRARRAHHLVECEAHEAAVRLQAVFASTTEAILIIDGDGRIEACNDAASAMLGYPDAELAGRPALLLLVDQIGQDRPFRDIVGFSEGRLVRSHWPDRAVRHHDGRSLPVDIALAPMALPDGLRFVATLHDVSAHKAIERLKDDFIATVSHELRTPLTSVVGALGLLRAGAVGTLPDAARRLVEIAESNSQRLIGLINDILDIEKIDSGRMRFDRQPLDLAHVARTAVANGAGLAESNAVSIALAAEEAPVIVSGDADKLVQVLANLLSNAIRFSPASGAVRVTVTRAGGEGVVAVQDEGPGVPPAFAAKIFERFAQAADSRVPGGTGLGLAISQEIVRAHGGRIWFDAAAARGARFAFALPLAPATRAASDSRQARLLVCEDQPEIAEVIARIIESQGCSVDCVTTARDMEEAARSGRYAGIVLDLLLTDAAGLDAVRRLRRRAETRTTPIVVVSDSAAAMEREVDAAALQVIDWIPKPVDETRLIAGVRRAIAHAAAARPTLLHLDDDADLLEVTAATLADQGRVLRATSLAAARALLADGVPDIVILDVRLPDGSGLALLPDLRRADGAMIPTIIYSSEDVGAAAKAKVAAVIVKSRRSLPTLAATIRRLLATAGEAERAA